MSTDTRQKIKTALQASTGATCPERPLVCWTIWVTRAKRHSISTIHQSPFLPSSTNVTGNSAMTKLWIGGQIYDWPYIIRMRCQISPAWSSNNRKNYLSDKIELTFLEKPPDGISLWDFNPAIELLFSYRLGGQPVFGDNDYIAVSRVSGNVRELGFLGG
jgi:hypothetical protein